MLTKDNIGRIGVGLAMIQAEKNRLKFMEQNGHNDRGIDAFIEHTDKENKSYLLMVQCKSSNSENFKIEGNKKTFYFDKIHYEYWTNYPLKGILTYATTNDEKVYWSKLDKTTLIETPTGCKLIIDEKIHFQIKTF